MFEKLQALFAARTMGYKWSGKEIIMRLDCLCPVDTMRKNYHQHPPINAILQELTSLQIKHNFSLRPVWAKRCWNEAADVLSKNDLNRFWDNVSGSKEMFVLTASDLAPPEAKALGACMPEKGQKAGNKRRRPSQVNMPIAWGSGAPSIRAQGQRRRKTMTHEPRPLREAPRVPARPSAHQLTTLLQQGLQDCARQAQSKEQTTGMRHYKRFCTRAGYTQAAPPLAEMRKQTQKWMYDALLSYVPRDGQVKKSIATGSI